MSFEIALQLNDSLFFYVSISVSVKVRFRGTLSIFPSQIRRCHTCDNGGFGSDFSTDYPKHNPNLNPKEIRNLRESNPATADSEILNS
jgi:hypothetical protein